MDRIVDIATDGCHLSRYRGFLKVARDGETLGQVPLDDIAALIVHGHGTTLSANMLTSLAERQVPTVLCASNHMPHSMLLPLAGHHMQGARMAAQAAIKAPLKKRLWQQLIKRKIRMQACVLEVVQHPLPALVDMAGKVRSGDPDNLEAQAARRYWPALMGKDFTRDRALPGSNALLNYGYIVLRAACARALVAAGLHPTLGIHHHAGPNNAALADDLIEPFRPFVDLACFYLLRAGVDNLTPQAKACFADLLTLDLPTDMGASPLGNCIKRAASSLAASFDQAAPALVLPDVPTPLQLEALKAMVATHAAG